MSIDRYYTQINSDLERIDKPGDEHGHDITDFWVDISGGLADERYYFTDLASALEFYLGGWRTHRLVTEEDGEGGERLGLYSRRRLIHGLSIHGDAPGSEGENARQILEAVVRKLEEEHP
jgi:hypothetical protein